MLFGSYRRSDAADPDTYVAAVAAVLALYSTDLIREVTDPRTGIQTSEKFMAFMPNAGELKHYCEGIAARNERLKRLGERRAPDHVATSPAAPSSRKKKICGKAKKSRWRDASKRFCGLDSRESRESTFADSRVEDRFRCRVST